MPTYDYACNDCGHEMEAFHSMTAPPLTNCPACGKAGLRKKIGPGAGLLFKGSGFYITDYRSESYKKGASHESPSKTEAKTEAKPAAKAESKPASPAPAAP